MPEVHALYLTAYLGIEMQTAAIAVICRGKGAVHTNRNGSGYGIGGSVALVEYCLFHMCEQGSGAALSAGLWQSGKVCHLCTETLGILFGRSQGYQLPLPADPKVVDITGHVLP